MKKMKEKGKNNIGWDKLVSSLSRDNNNINESGEAISGEKEKEIFNYLTEMNNLRGEESEVVDKAWNKLFRRLEEDNLLEPAGREIRFNFTALARIAAVIILTVGLTLTGRYVISNKLLSPATVISTTLTEKNIVATLPDGSREYLNRNSELNYKERYGKNA